MDGGTLDVSRLTFFEMKASASDTHVEGEDFQIRIVGLFMQRENKFLGKQDFLKLA